MSKYIKNSHKSMWKKTNHPTEKWGQDRNKTKKANGETEMVNKHKKRGLTSSLIKEMQIKQPQRFHFTPRRLTQVGRFETIKCW